MDVRWIAIATFLILGGVRIFELVLNNQHVRRLRARGATWHGRAGLEIIVFGQILFFGGILVEGYLFPPHPEAGVATWLLLGTGALGVALRYWCIFTLGDRWTLTIYTIDEPLVRRGPYRFLRHPNYVAVAIEVLALSAAIQAWMTMVAAGAVTLVGLLYRIQRENAALASFASETVPRQTS